MVQIGLNVIMNGYEGQTFFFYLNAFQSVDMTSVGQTPAVPPWWNMRNNRCLSF